LGKLLVGTAIAIKILQEDCLLNLIIVRNLVKMWQEYADNNIALLAKKSFHPSSGIG
jgi:hypothetical protein